MSSVCIIPARGGSKRLPHKNKLPFLGDPIISRPIKAALQSKVFDKVIVTSDDDTILSIADNWGASILLRPEELATDEISELESCMHVLKSLETLPDYFCVLYPCAVFITPEDISCSLDKMIVSEADVCMGVTKLSPHPYQTLIKDGEFYKLKFPKLNDTKYPDTYASNGSLYWFKTLSFMEKPTYYPDKLDVYETYSVDINTAEDFRKAEEICKKSLF